MLSTKSQLYVLPPIACHTSPPRYLQGNCESFDQLVNQFNFKSSNNDTPTQPAQLRVWIAALSHIVSRLERTHSALVEALVNMPWTTLDSATVKSYTVFIGMLLSARPEYLSLVLGKIAQGFTHRGSPSSTRQPTLLMGKPK